MMPALFIIVEQPDFVAEKTAFFMPTADGPCRFGQYSPYLRKVLRDIELADVLVFSSPFFLVLPDRNAYKSFIRSMPNDQRRCA